MCNIMFVFVECRDETYVKSYVTVPFYNNNCIIILG